MRKFLKLAVVVFGVFFMSGCAGLSEIARQLPTLDPSAEIEAVSILTDDFVNQPWDNILQVGLGYFLALIRRKYKKVKGAKL